MVFYVVYYPSDRKLVVQQGDVLTLHGSCDIGDKVTGRFLTENVSQDGREVEEWLDYDGYIVYVNTVKNRCRSLLEEAEKVTKGRKKNNKDVDMEELFNLGRQHARQSARSRRGAATKLHQYLDELKEDERSSQGKKTVPIKAKEPVPKSKKTRVPASTIDVENKDKKLEKIASRIQTSLVHMEGEKDPVMEVEKAPVMNFDVSSVLGQSLRVAADDDMTYHDDMLYDGESSSSQSPVPPPMPMNSPATPVTPATSAASVMATTWFETPVTHHRQDCCSHCPQLLARIADMEAKFQRLEQFTTWLSTQVQAVPSTYGTLQHHVTTGMINQQVPVSTQHMPNNQLTYSMEGASSFSVQNETTDTYQGQVEFEECNRQPPRRKLFNNYNKEQLQAIVGRCSTVGIACKTLLRKMFTEKELEGRSLSGCGGRIKKSPEGPVTVSPRPGLDDREKVQLLIDIVMEKFPDVRRRLVRERLADALKPSASSTSSTSLRP